MGRWRTARASEPICRAGGWVGWPGVIVAAVREGVGKMTGTDDSSGAYWADWKVMSAVRDGYNSKR